MCSDRILSAICMNVTQRKISEGHCKEVFNSIQKTGNMK